MGWPVVREVGAGARVVGGLVVPDWEGWVEPVVLLVVVVVEEGLVEEGLVEEAAVGAEERAEVVSTLLDIVLRCFGWVCGYGVSASEERKR